MRIKLTIWGAATILFFSWLVRLEIAGPSWAAEKRQAPEFPSRKARDWINSPPLTQEDLRGKVVMLYVWTFECWNCERSMPWVKGLYDKYRGRGFEIVGIHSPEFERERDIGGVKKAVAAHQLRFPNMIDNDFKYWRALDNQYWPAFYLVDKTGRIRRTAIGETHAGDALAQAVERAIEELLAEPAP